MADVWYEYECAHGHGVGWNQPLTKCHAYWNGKPCDGALKQTHGPRGTRKPAAPSESVSTAIAKLPEADRRRLAPQPPRGAAGGRSRRAS